LSFLSVLLIVNNSLFQRSKYLAVVHDLTGNVYFISSSVKSYINLRHANDDLQNRIAELEMTVQGYEHQLELLRDTNITGKIDADSAHSLTYTFTPAHVVYNNLSGLENYIMLDKGYVDGINVDMGVVSPNGIVGVVMSVSPRFSIVIPVLNPKFRLSCKIKRNNYFGSLVWDGKDPRYTYLEELPRHVEFDIQDTIVTSGYSTIFPEGLLVGTITDSQKQKNDNYNYLQIKLFTDFSTLTDVLIIKNRLKDEQEKLQKIVNL
jgi:rod shape-determining protein MreC